MLVRIVAVVVVVLGLGLLYLRMRGEMQYDQKLLGIGRQMAPEIATCKERLTQFHAAWKKYGAEHRGAAPPTIDSLFPKYVKSPSLLTCPTAKRYFDQGKQLSHGVYDGEHKMTYGFLWLAAGNVVAVRRQGEQAPLINCPVHYEVVSRFVYDQSPGGFVIPPSAEKKLQGVGATASTIVIQRDGEITLQAEES